MCMVGKGAHEGKVAHEEKHVRTCVLATKSNCVQNTLTVCEMQLGDLVPHVA